MSALARTMTRVKRGWEDVMTCIEGERRLGQVALTLQLSSLEAAEIDAFAAGQADRPSRPEAVRRLLRQALGLASPPEGRGLKPEQLNAGNDG